jgi:hypothetical protein
MEAGALSRVVTRSPARRSATSRQPSGQAMRVPAVKHGTTGGSCIRAENGRVSPRGGLDPGPNCAVAPVKPSRSMA